MNLVAKLQEKLGSLIPQVGQVLDDILPLAEPTFGFRASVTQHLPQVFGELFNFGFCGLDNPACPWTLDTRRQPRGDRGAIDDAGQGSAAKAQNVYTIGSTLNQIDGRDDEMLAL